MEKKDHKFCSRACYRRYQGETGIERKVRLSLKRLGIFFLQEAVVGGRLVDFLLPISRIALEVDGTYWHRDKERDQRKTTLLESYGWCVVRITEEQIVGEPALDALVRDRVTILRLPMAHQ